MTLRNFIRKYKTEIDAFIIDVHGEHSTLNYEERRLWILNDEFLYLWAKDEGVKDI